MWGDDAVFGFEEWVISFDRLCGYNVKSCCINFAAVKRICKILLYYQLSTAVVDKDNSILLPLFARTITSPG